MFCSHFYSTLIIKNRKRGNCSNIDNCNGSLELYRYILLMNVNCQFCQSCSNVRVKKTRPIWESQASISPWQSKYERWVLHNRLSTYIHLHQFIPVYSAKDVLFRTIHLWIIHSRIIQLRIFHPRIIQPRIFHPRMIHPWIIHIRIIHLRINHRQIVHPRIIHLNNSSPDHSSLNNGSSPKNSFIPK